MEGTVVSAATYPLLFLNREASVTAINITPAAENT